MSEMAFPTLLTFFLVSVSWRCGLTDRVIHSAANVSRTLFI